MAERDSFRVRLGTGKPIKIGLSKKGQDERDPAPPGPPPKGSAGPLMTGGQADDEIVPQMKGVQFYDIGMVLNEDDEYDYVSDFLLEEVFPDADTSTSTMTLAQAEAFDNLLIGKYLAGLFEKIPGTTKPNRKVVKFDAENYWIDVSQVSKEEEAEPVVSVVGQDMVRPKLTDTTGPNWPNTGWRDKGEEKGGVLKLIPNIKSLEVLGLGYFHNFKTDDLAHFKITGEPNYGAPEVELTGLPFLRAVYLVPQILRNAMSYLAFGTFIPGNTVDNQAWRRISPYAGYVIPLVSSAALPNVTDPDTITALAQQIVDDGVYDYALSIESARFPPPRVVTSRHQGHFAYRRDFLQAVLHEGEFAFTFFYFTTLRAVLKTNGKTYYVWLRDPGIDASPFLLQWVAVGPFAHGLITDAP